MNQEWIAPEGTVWMCGFCAKKAKYRAGWFPGYPASWGWDESCFLNAVLVYEDTLKPGGEGEGMKTTEEIYDELRRRFRTIADRLDGNGKTDLDGILWVMAVEQAGLIAKWRSEADEDDLTHGQDPDEYARMQTHRDCADELESAVVKYRSDLALSYHDTTGLK